MKGLKKYIKEFFQDIYVNYKDSLIFQPTEFLTWKFILDNPDIFTNFEALSDNPAITFDLIQDNPHIKWNMSLLSKNPNINLEIISDNPNLDWNFGYLSRNPNLSWNYIKNNLDKNWFLYDLFSIQGSKLGLKIIEFLRYFNWSFYTLSVYFNLDLFLKYPHKEWDYDIISENPNITWKIVQDNPDKPWNYHFLSRNPNITWEIVCDNPDKPWNYQSLSRNPNITWKIVCDNQDKPWNYKYLSENPNIAWENIKNFSVLHIYNYIFYNSKTLDKIILTKKYIAISKIKKWFTKILWDPNTKLGRIWMEKNYEVF